MRFKGIILCFFIMIMVTQNIVTSLNQTDIDTGPNDVSRNVFSNCYIEADGLVSDDDWASFVRLPNMCKTFWLKNILNNSRIFVSFWRVVLESDSEIIIYNEKDGEIIWHHDKNNIPVLNIIGFAGKYESNTTINGQLHVTICGNSLIVLRGVR